MDTEYEMPTTGDGGVRLFSPDQLRRLVRLTFVAAGSSDHEANRLAHYLVEANLTGHDSHGVIRVSYYVDYIIRGQIVLNQRASVVFETPSVLVINGNGGFGQVIGEDAMKLSIDKCSGSGVCLTAIRNSGHLGRIGDWPQLLADAGMASLHFVNTSGFGILVAPFGGIDRRLSANPIAAGIPRSDGRHVILDISTAAVAEGKLKVARNAGSEAPANSLIDSNGAPTRDPRDFYASPPGAILPFGGHKGYGLGIVAELLAGALGGGGCSKFGADRLLNGMLSIIVDPSRIPRDFDFSAELEAFVSFVKSSRLAPGCDEILLPGEIEERTRRDRLKSGVPLDAATRAALLAAMESLGIVATEIEILR